MMSFAVAISVPGVQLLAVVGGWLFGWLHGTIYVAVAATIAASAVFLLARSALAQALRDRAGPAAQRFANGFRDHAPSYVFVLHLAPLPRHPFPEPPVVVVIANAAIE